MPLRVLLVGCGVTSAVTGKLLRSQFDNINITIWEKLYVSGGRFISIVGGSSNELSVDLGAQYITTSDESVKCYEDIYTSLFNNNVLECMDNKIKGMKPLASHKKNYVAPLGMKSIVDHFLGQMEPSNICYGNKLVSLDRAFKKWNACSDSGIEDLFDIVILTIPVPEMFYIGGDIKSLILNDNLINKNLSAVKYSSRYALGLFFDVDVATDCDAEYIDDDSILRYVAYDSWKRKEDTFRSVIIHTTIQFGERCYKDNVSDVKEIIMKRVEELFSHWPKPLSSTIYQWRHSQALHFYDSQPGAIILSEEPLLIAGGDGFVGSTFDQCLFSAKRIIKLISKKMSRE